MEPEEKVRRLYYSHYANILGLISYSKVGSATNLSCVIIYDFKF
jgi:hypothetical protein